MLVTKMLCLSETLIAYVRKKKIIFEKDKVIGEIDGKHKNQNFLIFCLH